MLNKPIGMHHLVKITVNEDGDKVNNPQWHLVQEYGDTPRALYTGAVFGEGEGSAVFKEKHVKAGVPCPNCKAIVKWFKSIQL